jgi:hypothetical protein
MRISSTWRALWERLHKGADRIKHWSNRKDTSREAADNAHAAPVAAHEVPPASETNTYQKRQYRLEVRRYRRERREARCQKHVGLATLVAVIVYAGITLYLAVVAHEQLVYSERPWVGLATVTLTGKATPGKPIKIAVFFSNSGRSPALHVFEYLILKPWVYPSNDDEIPLRTDPDLRMCVENPPKWADDLGGGILLPGAPTGQMEYQAPIIPDDLMTLLDHPLQTATIPPAEYANVGRSKKPIGMNGQFGLFLSGCIYYFDEFRKSHSTYVCSFYIPSESAPNGGLFANCPKGNSAN